MVVMMGVRHVDRIGRAVWGRGKVSKQLTFTTGTDDSTAELGIVNQKERTEMPTDRVQR
jgi:hypothetical protein